MVPRAPARPGLRGRCCFGRALALALTLLLAAPACHPTAAASLSARDLQLLGRALAFVQSPPAGAPEVAIAYAPDNPVSRRDAEAIADELGSGLLLGASVLWPRPVATDVLAGRRASLLIAAEGTDGAALAAASRALRALCVSADFEAVRAGHCVMAIRSEPRVEILVNHAAAEAAGVSFAAAFRMMIHEI